MGYRAFMVNKDGDDFTAGVQTLDDSSLPEGDVTVAVEWSDLNYKDGLACTPNGRVVFKYPMTIGIDFAGTVLESSDPRYAAGDAVVATGYDLGTGHPGGYAGAGTGLGRLAVAAAARDDLRRGDGAGHRRDYGGHVD